MRFSRTKQKSLLALFLIAEFFVMSALPASAGLFGGAGVSVPSASSVLSDMEQRYHLNVGAIQNQGEALNVASNKALVPEVSLFFSPSDPKPGQKLAAKAFPIYFSNPEESLYYTWYLKRKGCDLENNVSSNNPCDADGDGDITPEDWKIAAMSIVAQNGYDHTDTNYGSDQDDDGYRAKFGGGDKTNVQSHCYIDETETGKNYEFVRSLPDDAAGCASGTPVCVLEQLTASPGGSDDITTAGSGNFYISGYPICSSDALTCSVGVAKCTSTLTNITSSSLTSPTSCTAISQGTADPYCFHFFPNADNDQSGNGSFGASEERFWGTNPQDPSTADNGNKDEANVVGLGQSTFTWNYASGDQVGVAVEGTSMIPTKNNDSSYMIMWAFPKKKCTITDVAEKVGAYVMNVGGYDVSIPAVKGLDLDSPLNKCAEKNLVDPTVGGQATNLDVSVAATPDNPINDETSDKGGDIVTAQATVNNAQHNVTDMLFDWKVEISKDIQFNTFKDITQPLRTAGLLGNTKGNALDSIRVKLDMPQSIINGYLSGDIGYLRFKSSVVENFSGNATRKGKSDVIVKFTSTAKKISAYKAGTELVLGTRRATLGTTKICNDNAIDRAACRVIKNEIVGLAVDNTAGDLANFYWTVNGAPLTCSKKVSNNCSDTQQGNENFFPVVGNPGDTYTVTVTANNVNTGDALTLSRTFGVVAPEVTIESLDKNSAWPKLLGQYKDLTGKATNCPNGLCNDYSTSMFEAFADGTLGFRATFIPGFLADAAQREWSVDGETVTENAAGEISFSAAKPAGGIYTIGLTAQVKQSDETRGALLDIWGISPFDSPEIRFSVSSQVQLQAPGLVEGPLMGPRKYLAAIVSYIPASVMFTFRIFLSAVLVLFAMSFLYTLLEDRQAKRLETSFTERG